MIRYFAVMFALLGGAFVAANVVIQQHQASTPLQSSCNRVAHYPLLRLAEAGDVGAMAYLGERMVVEGCSGKARAQGLRYLEVAADAGHETAYAFLTAYRSDRPRHMSACAALMTMVMPGVDDPDVTLHMCD